MARVQGGSGLKCMRCGKRSGGRHRPSLSVNMFPRPLRLLVSWVPASVHTGPQAGGRGVAPGEAAPALSQAEAPLPDSGLAGRPRPSAPHPRLGHREPLLPTLEPGVESSLRFIARDFSLNLTYAGSSALRAAVMRAGRSTQPGGACADAQGFVYPWRPRGGPGSRRGFSSPYLRSSLSSSEAGAGANCPVGALSHRPHQLPSPTVETATRRPVLGRGEAPWEAQAAVGGFLPLGHTSPAWQRDIKDEAEGLRPGRAGVGGSQDSRGPGEEDARCRGMGARAA